MDYVLRNFFTHKDYLAPAAQIPGTIFTPLHFLFSAALLTLITFSSVYVSRRKRLIRPVLASVWILMVIWEFVIVYWDSVAGKVTGLDLQTGLSLYPCSIYLFAMPIILWGKGLSKQACCGYLCTLGLLGAVINFIFPLTILINYSCISFAGFHTFGFHGAMLFSYLVVILSGIHRYDMVTGWQSLILPSVPGLIMSIPANLVNYALDADYMFFRGKFPVVARVFGNTRTCVITLVIYTLYIVIPALFYLPAYLHNRRLAEEEELMVAAAEYI